MTAAKIRMFPAALAALAVVSGCAPQPRADNFRQVMEKQVGKKTDDSDFYPVLYRLRQVDSKPLANGQREDKYLAGYQGKCELYFEVEPASRTVTGWRAADSGERNCVIETRQP